MNEEESTVRDEEDIGKAKKTDEEKTSLFDWVEIIVTAMTACILIFLFIGRTVSVSGPSMESTLFDSERLIISKLFYTPKQGDIIVFRNSAYKDDPLVKRVIALEGQTVDIDFEKGVVYVDGKELDEPYVNSPTNRELDFEDEITVPEGCVFVLGDNRNRSNDSRDARIGCVDTRYILGKVLWRIMPLSRFGSVY